MFATFFVSGVCRLATDPDADPEVTRKHTQISDTYSDSEDELTDEAKGEMVDVRMYVHV